MKNNKVYFLSLALVIISATTFGQASLEVFAGVNYSNIFDLDDNVNLTYIPRVGLSIGAATSFRINNNFTLQSGFDIEQRGSSITAKGNMGSDYFDFKEIKATYISIPLLLNIYPLIKNPLTRRIYLQTGLSGGYNIWENIKSGGGCLLVASKGPGESSSLDLGLIIGTGFSLNNSISILARQEFGLTDTFGLPTEKYYNTNTYLILLYRLM